MAKYKLPPEAYYDQAWLEKEKQKLFGGSWLYAGLETELPDPGSYKTVTAGFSELIVVRDKQGNLNALHNMCRHRGAQLVQGEGNCKLLVCPYHRWTYELDGKMRAAPKAKEFDDLDRENLGLHVASVSTWMGLIFVHPDENPPMTLDAWLGGVKEELGIFDVPKLQLLKSDSMIFEANWKLYLENHIDWLHLWYVHPETLEALTHNYDDVKAHERHWVSYDPVKDENREEFRASNPLPDIPHVIDQADRYSETGAHFIFPNLPIFTGSSFFAITELVPLSPEKTRMNIDVLGLPGGDVDGFLTLFNAITKGEDAAIIEVIQKNMRSERFSVGPIAHTYEKAISDFHDNYLALMEG